MATANNWRAKYGFFPKYFIIIRFCQKTYAVTKDNEDVNGVCVFYDM